MAYYISEVKADYFPDEDKVCVALNKFGIEINDISNFLNSFICQALITKGYGYQRSIAKELEKKIKEDFATRFRLISVDKRYLNTGELNIQADVVLVKNPQDFSKMYFEIEFRPNAEKDLIKFQVAEKENTLGVGILIVALDKKKINGKYKSMPEFSKIDILLHKLKPNFPIILYGIHGENR